MNSPFLKKCRQVVLFLPFTTVLPLLPRLEFLKDLRLVLATGVGIVFHLLAPYTSSREFLQPSAQDRRSTWFLLLACLVVYYSSLVEAAYGSSLSNPKMLTVGIALAILALGFRSWTTSILGKLFTATITLQDDHNIISEGPYRYLRHPAYLASIVTLLAVALIFQSWWGVIAFVGLGLPAYLYRIHVEELALVEKFGDAYVEKSKHTWRLIPFVY